MARRMTGAGRNPQRMPAGKARNASDGRRNGLIPLIKFLDGH